MLDNNLEMLIGITVAYFSGAFILTVFFYYLYFLNRHLYLKKWVQAWLILSFAYVFLFIALFFDIAFIYGIYSFLIVSYGYIFLIASAIFLKFKIPKTLKYILIIGYSLIIILTILTHLVAWSIVAAFIISSLFTFIIGINFTKKQDVLFKITGYIVIIFSIVSFFYPVLADQRWFLPWGYVVLGMLGLFMGMSLIQIHFQTQKQDFLELQSKLEYMVHHDPLTGIHNRLFLNDEFDKIDNENRVNIGLLFIDLNNFKQVNDKLGHRKGDEVLIDVTRILETIIEDNGLLCRFGGDEFIVIFYHSTKEKTEHYKNRIINYVSDDLIDGIKLDFAVGASFKESADQSIYKLLEQAETSMYTNKAKQKDNRKQ
ncbi:MAG: diguanylate cyclase domain-containing protein [Bacillota bacterium]